MAKPVLTLAQLKHLGAVCAGSTELLYSAVSGKKIIVLENSSALSDLNGRLASGLQAENFQEAGIVLCLTEMQQELESCHYPPFFSVPRIRHDLSVKTIGLADPAGTRMENVLTGSSPPACSQAGTIDASVQSLDGEPPGASDILALLEQLQLARTDADQDGLNGIEEFLLNSDPRDQNSPGESLLITANGSADDLTLYEGDALTVAISVYPGAALGRAAEYRVWADTSLGLFAYQHPTGFRGATAPQLSVEAPVIALLDYPLITLPEVRAGEYALHFRLDENQQKFSDSQVRINVLPDPCREHVTLPLAVTDSWNPDCGAIHSALDTELSLYYTVELASQTRIRVDLTSNESTARMFLLSGSGRNGQVLTSAAAAEALTAVLDAGTYTLEIVSSGAGDQTGTFTLSAGINTLPWQFTDVTTSAGFDYSHGYGEPASGISLDRRRMAPGVAAGDFNQDGWIDLYIIGGTSGPNLLFRNNSDGTFTEAGSAAGVALAGAVGSGAVFGDYDGDGWPDLFVGGLNGSPAVLFHNKGNGTFSDVTQASGITGIINSFSGSFGDYDNDGDLDLFVTHWTANRQGKYLWRNNGDGTFTDVSAQAGIPDDLMSDYSVNFADIDNDGWPDLLIAADFGTSQVFRNKRDGTFSNITTPVIDDENGMGAAVGDYDNDGYLDWFVSSIYDPNSAVTAGSTGSGLSWGDSGNRLYRNLGNGEFEDVTDSAGVRYGYWGWGSCFADFNNDGHLDLYHVNGFTTDDKVFSGPFEADPARMYIARGNGSFTEQSVQLGTADTGQGRGLVCFDYDRDGDVDLFIANLNGPPVLLRNDGGNDFNYLHLKVAGEKQNSEAIGARISVTAAGITQIRELRAGNNYLSQNPAEAYFGVGDADVIEQIRISWPSGREALFQNIQANQLLVIPAN